MCIIIRVRMYLHLHGFPHDISIIYSCYEISVKDKKKEKKRKLKEVETKKQKEDDKVRKRLAWQEKQQQEGNKDNHKIEKDSHDKKGQ